MKLTQGDSKLPASPCPGCRKLCDAATLISDADTDRDPHCGDVSVCLYCGSINQYDKVMQLYKCDITTLSGEKLQEVLRVRRAVLKIGPSAPAPKAKPKFDGIIVLSEKNRQ